MLDPIRLVDVPQLLRCTYGVTTTYNRLYMAFVNGNLPQVQRRRGRLFVEHADLLALARTLGMIEKPDKAVAA